MAKQRSSASMWRLRGYLRPYRARFIVMFFLAGIGIGAAIVIPLVTKAVIDGPIANSNPRGLLALGLFAIGLGVVEAFLMFLRRWIVSKGTNGVETGIRAGPVRQAAAAADELPLALAERAAAEPDHERPGDRAPVPRLRHAVHRDEHRADRRRHRAADPHVLAARPRRRSRSTVPITWMCLRNEREYTRLSRKIQDQVGDVASTVEEGAYGLRVIKSFGRAAHMFDTFDARSRQLYDTSMERVRLSAKFWTFLEVIPSATLIVVLGFGAVAAGQGQLTLGSLVAFITLMLSLVWPVAALGFLLAMTQEAFTAADRIMEIFDAEIDIVDGTETLDDPRGRVQLHRRRLPLSRLRGGRAARREPGDRAGRDRGRRRRHRLRQDDPHPAQSPGCTT